MHRSSRPVLVLALALRAAAAGAEGPPTPDRPAPTAGVTLDAVLGAPPSTVLLQDGVPGAAAALVVQGAVVDARGFGWADVARRVRATRETVFEAASISKVVTAFVVMRLVEEGRLDLDAPIERALGGFVLPGGAFDARGVTARRILSHTAGLNIGGYLGFDPGTPLQSLRESLRGARDAGGEALAVVAEPGSGYRYSGGGYTLLQLAIEVLTGERFAAVAKRSVLEPLGMRHSSFEQDATVRKRLAFSYDVADETVGPSRFTAQAAAGLYTTASDLARLAAALVPGPGGAPPGRGVLSPGSVAAMLTPQPGAVIPASGETEQWGLGIGLTHLEPGGALLAFHPGDNLPGFHAMLAVVPDAKAGFVLLTNGEGGRSVRRDATCRFIASLALGTTTLCTDPRALQ